MLVMNSIIWFCSDTHLKEPEVFSVNTPIMIAHTYTSHMLCHCHFCPLNLLYVLHKTSLKYITCTLVCFLLPSLACKLYKPK